ncbi:nitroreductase family protein [Streptomyces sp. NBC_00385]|uniref:nitroreductase family protein n=1 Tax=Streptomyces sp. NBC_00385 TaxID=2975733 RepID=UPI002DD7C952|nr:nitroreductase [Streptomyces sp. NBC_00385]WRZ08194.1 nitroreductase [Streptomyces sp. NBC_00385]
MDVMTAVLTRRSEHILHAPAPDDAEFTYLLRGASLAPDHGRLRPWRWILLRGDERAELGLAIAAETGADAAETERLRNKYQRAPLSAALVFVPRTHPVPEWEQLAAASCVAHSLMLLLHARDYGSVWRTGRLATSPVVGEFLGLRSPERLLGILDIGTPDVTSGRRRRVPDDMSENVTRFDELREPGSALAGSRGER